MKRAGRVVLLAAALTASVATPAAAAARSVISSPAGFSDDGRLQLFSTASSLIATDTNKTSDVYERDLLTGAVRLISATPLGLAGNGPSTAAAMSADGNWVVFTSAANNLDGSGPACDVYVRDVRAGRVIVFSALDNLWKGAASQAVQNLNLMYERPETEGLL